ncbi:VOC family protein [Mucilaginibacter ginkgonis]|uniref:Glyoxalase/fosfomycin resistance/dioxygenase domain-containing protein n=1 Tax=Mucilaginibacter ginkgonis TaxID=2682091 RepID=A0A6I4HXK1_9SPHI|nr:VOC family protein [Mucilaginibacter ginkgonis]QQL51069.1 hypothetical protein GO620_006365 [Mucilaginibacter ginkgonis]
MSLLSVIPTIFYKDLNVAIRFFTLGLGFKIMYLEDNFCVVKRDETTIHLVENNDLARGNRPEIRIATDDIDSYYDEIITNHPEILHPNLNIIKDQPWGLREFALMDETMSCIIIQQEMEAAV